ncbi:hypothetical protein KXV68_001366, partial [Aspergillus fumigatus]
KSTIPLKSTITLPFLITYFGMISLDGAKAILCHAFSSNLEWASVAEDDEADRVLHRDEQDGEPVQVGLDNL